MCDAALKVNSFFRIDKRFISLNEFHGPILDKDYIEGALLVSIYDNELFDLSLWDYIDQLWAYLVDAICAVAAGDGYSCCFPDQPIRIEFTIVSGNLVKIFIGVGEGRTGVVEKYQFVSAFGKAAIQFFSRMTVLIPEESFIFQGYIERLDNVINMK